MKLFGLQRMAASEMSVRRPEICWDISEKKSFFHNLLAAQNFSLKGQDIVP
jgi:hypothetical protein